MKKLFLSAALATCAMGLNAQTNFVTNGDFEAEGAEMSEPHDWSADDKLLTSLPGWQLEGLDAWSVLAMLAPVEIDEEFTFEGNTQCLHIYRFDDNGWQAGSVKQEITGLVPGTTYTLGAIVARASGTTVDWDDPYFLVQLEPANASGQYTGEKFYIQDKDEAIAEADVWGEYAKEFTATGEKAMLTFSHNNVKWEGNHSEGFWMDVDDVFVGTPEDYAAYKASKGGVNGVAEVYTPAEERGVYSLDGVRVANSISELNGAKGIYVVRTADKAVKVVR